MLPWKKECGFVLQGAHEWAIISIRIDSLSCHRASERGRKSNTQGHSHHRVFTAPAALPLRPAITP